MGCDGSAGFGSSVAGGVGCSFSDGAEASGWRSDSSGVLDGSLTCDSVVPLSGCPDAGFVWIQLSDTPSVSSAEWSSSFGSVLRVCSTSVFSVACAVSAWRGASLLPEEETVVGCSAICEVLLHPEIRHKRTMGKRTAILDFIRFTPFDHILPDENRFDKDAF